MDQFQVSRHDILWMIDCYQYQKFYISYSLPAECSTMLYENVYIVMWNFHSFWIVCFETSRRFDLSSRSLGHVISFAGNAQEANMAGNTNHSKLMHVILIVYCYFQWSPRPAVGECLPFDRGPWRNTIRWGIIHLVYMSMFFSRKVVPWILCACGRWGES